MSAERIFGTDGIRGRAGEGWLTAANAARVGLAVGQRMRQDHQRGPRRALLGHDGRRSGPMLEAALAGGLAAAGFESFSAGLITTPGLAWSTRQGDFLLGLMVSASHNPSEDNGIKVFTHEGEKLSDEVEREVEGLLAAEAAAAPPPRPPAVDPSLETAYLEHLLFAAGEGLHLNGTSLVLDCANGGGSRVAPRVFGRLGATVHVLASEPDGENINRDCGSTHPETLQHEVRRRGARLGIALDGDGDRCILVDEHGELVHGDGILTILGRRAAERKDWRDRRIVATVMSNRGLHHALREVGVEVVEVPVGDRAVVEAMRTHSLELGGEQSGHIVLGRSNAYIGDGTFTALAVLRVMQESERPLSELAKPYQPFPQVLLNVPVSRKPNLAEMPSVVAAMRAVQQDLGQDGRVLLRYSGTEPLARVMVEGPDAQRIGAAARRLADLLAREIGA